VSATSVGGNRSTNAEARDTEENCSLWKKLLLNGREREARENTENTDKWGVEGALSSEIEKNADTQCGRGKACAGCKQGRG